jgi:hypothetical protein
MAVSPFLGFFYNINSIIANNLPIAEGEPKYFNRPFKTRN